MASLRPPTAPFRLPPRVRFKPERESSSGPRLALADRIAGLRDIETIEYGNDAPPREAHFYLRRRTLCSIQPHGITVHGLDNRDRNQVIAGGWGSLVGDRVLVHLPRDARELDVCWRIVCQAHESLTSATDRPDQVHNAARIWPQISRTNLQ